MSYRQPFVGDYPIYQGYGKTEYSQNHTGIDYACPLATQILASADGQVFFAGWKDGGYGNCVFLKHPDGFVTIYEHLLSQIPVTVDQNVRQGQLIGYSGSTGNSTGPHLHFEMHDASGKVVNPLRYLQNVVDTVTQNPQPEPQPKKLKGADELSENVQIVAPAGAWAWSPDFSKRQTVYPCGTKLRFTGNTKKRNEYTYCEVYPEPAKYWVAVHDNDCQILDNQAK